ncbi:MAG: VanW family protein [Bacillota bacterium]|jgi:hypothetical protein
MQIQIRSKSSLMFLYVLVLVAIIFFTIFLSSSHALAIPDEYLADGQDSSQAQSSVVQVQDQPIPPDQMQLSFTLEDQSWQTFEPYSANMPDFLQLRTFILDAGGTVSWLDNPGVVFFSVGNRTLAYCQKVKYLYIGQNNANGITWQKIYYEQPIKIVAGNSYLNRQILIHLGMTANWQVDMRKLDITLSPHVFNTGYLPPTMQELWTVIGSDLQNSLPKPSAKLLGSKTTYFNANLLNRTSNIKLASKAVNGLVLAPNQTFSFNKTVGPRSPKRGYKKAIIFMNGKKAEDYGGGVCQVSSTIYNAAIKANLKIVERHRHSIAVNYVAPDSDATVFYGEKDFRFTNNTKGNIIIKSKVGSNYLTIEIWSKI